MARYRKRQRFRSADPVTRYKWKLLEAKHTASGRVLVWRMRWAKSKQGLMMNVCINQYDFSKVIFQYVLGLWRPFLQY